MSSAFLKPPKPLKIVLKFILTNPLIHDGEPQIFKNFNNLLILLHVWSHMVTLIPYIDVYGLETHYMLCHIINVGAFDELKC